MTIRNKIILLLMTLFLGTAVTVEKSDTVKDALVGFATTRGFSTLESNSPCSPLVLSGPSSQSIDWNASCVQNLRLDKAGSTLTFSNGERQGRVFMIVTQDVTGSRTITWPASVKWASASAPTLGGANRVDVIEFIVTSSGSYYGLEHDRNAAK